MKPVTSPHSATTRPNGTRAQRDRAAPRPSAKMASSADAPGPEFGVRTEGTSRAPAGPQRWTSWSCRGPAVPRRGAGGEPAGQLPGQEHLGPADRSAGPPRDRERDREPDRATGDRPSSGGRAPASVIRAGPRGGFVQAVGDRRRPHRARASSSCRGNSRTCKRDSRAGRFPGVAPGAPLGLRRKAQLLHRDAAILVLVLGQDRPQRRHRQPVVQPAAEEVEDQAGRIEPEGAEVVDAIARPSSRSRIQIALCPNLKNG